MGKGDGGKGGGGGGSGGENSPVTLSPFHRSFIIGTKLKILHFIALHIDSK